METSAHCIGVLRCEWQQFWPKMVEVGPDWTVHFQQACSKRAGTGAHARYEQYKSADSISDFYDRGGTHRDLQHDFLKGLVHFTAPDGTVVRNDRPPGKMSTGDTNAVQPPSTDADSSGNLVAKPRHMSKDGAACGDVALKRRRTGPETAQVRKPAASLPDSEQGSLSVVTDADSGGCSFLKELDLLARQIEHNDVSARELREGLIRVCATTGKKQKAQLLKLQDQIRLNDRHAKALLIRVVNLVKRGS